MFCLFRNLKSPGSFECRAGYASEIEPRLQFRNLVGLPKTKRDGEFIMVGDAQLELDHGRMKIRSPFDRNVVTQFELLENVFDHVFDMLGVDGDRVDHPLLLTEPVAQPNYSRARYGIDALFSYQYNFLQGRVSPQAAASGCALIVSSGWETTHVLPVVQGRACFDWSYRLDIGGLQTFQQLHAITMLKYPQHASLDAYLRTFELMETQCRMAIDYSEELRAFESNYAGAPVCGMQCPNVPSVTYQLPFEGRTAIFESEASADESRLAREAAKTAAGQRLRDLQNRRREEKFAEKQRSLDALEDLRQQKLDERISQDTFLERIREGDFDDENDFEMTYQKLKKAVEILRSKVLGTKEEADELRNVADDDQPLELRFPLVLIADEQLSGEQRRQKRVQQMQSARVQKRRERDVARAAEEVEKQRLFAQHALQPQLVIQEIEKMKQVILDRQARRKQTKTELQNRRSGSSKRRMRIVAALGSRNEEEFGDNDEDWEVYRDISKKDSNAVDSDSEDDSRELNKLELTLEELEPQRVLIKEAAAASVTASKILTAEDFQMRFASELIRAPEILFQPSLMGSDTMGLAGLMHRILTLKVDHNAVAPLAQNVFLTGGNTVYSGFAERLQRELTACCPFQTEIQVYRASDPRLDAWRGAQQFALSAQFGNSTIERSQYLECGHEYLREHFCSNFYQPSTAPLAPISAAISNTIAMLPAPPNISFMAPSTAILTADEAASLRMVIPKRARTKI